MKKAPIVVCKNCGATFRNRRFWSLPKNDPTPRLHCVRCWAKGPFEEATKEDIENFSKKLTHNFNIFAIMEILTFLFLVASFIYGFLK